MTCVAEGFRSEKARSKAKRDEGPKPAGRINVNAATAAELEALPGIGPVIARRIVEGRPYRSVDELERVKGIGKKGTAQIAAKISFKGFWAVSLALTVVVSDLRRAQGLWRSCGYEKAVWHFFRRVLSLESRGI